MKLDYIMLTLRRDTQKTTYYSIPFILNGQNSKINRGKVDQWSVGAGEEVGKYRFPFGDKGNVLELDGSNGCMTL